MADALRSGTGPLVSRVSDLERFIARVLESVDFLPGDASRVASLMAEADARGADGHGVIRLPQYVRRIQSGGINRRPNIRLIREQPATALLDGDNAMGHLIMSRPAAIAIAKFFEKANGLKSLPS